MRHVLLSHCGRWSDELSPDPYYGPQSLLSRYAVAIKTHPATTLKTPSTRIINAPDLPNDVETLFIFANTLDMRLSLVTAGFPDLGTITHERAR